MHDKIISETSNLDQMGKRLTFCNVPTIFFTPVIINNYEKKKERKNINILKILKTHSSTIILTNSYRDLIVTEL